MSRRLRTGFNGLVTGLAHLFGSNLIDYRTGRKIGRAFLVPWRGKILIIGLREHVIPVFLPQERATYWKQEIGFTVHSPVDFPRERQ